MEFLVSYNQNNITLVNQQILKYDSSFKIIEELNDELSLCSSNLSINEINALCISNKVYLVRHIAKIDNKININDNITQYLIDNLDKELSYSFQILYDNNRICNEFMNNTCTILNDLGYILDVKNSKQIISLLTINNMIYIGFGNSDINLSKFKCGKVHYAKDDLYISRSEYKLLEATNTFNIDLNKYNKAIDAGASPGGWSKLLAQHKINVSAIDPANLDKRLLNNKYINHYQETIQQFLNTNNDNDYDLIVNDMKMDPRKSIELMSKFNKNLQANATIIMTFKLGERYNLRYLDGLLDIFSNHFKILHVRQLFHNRNELTVIGKK